MSTRYYGEFKYLISVITNLKNGSIYIERFVVLNPHLTLIVI